MIDNDDFDDDDEIEVPAFTFSFKWIDVAGHLVNIAGNATCAVGHGLQELAQTLRINSWHERNLDAQRERMAMDRNEFDDIISRPVLLDEPGQE